MNKSRNQREGWYAGKGFHTRTPKGFSLARFRGLTKKMAEWRARQIAAMRH